ncbi:ExbD/TolR family protein [Marinobacter sp. AL4B]|uniref:ExbD/TolR family protein n=1 Tax=Marinobacter sp. AL4B TaxID=2871173 RepID=UPI001CAA58E6|nr:biopolymer transporter ExbD [Marinobacter sp. AL4B]MBZ0335498.1 biopolymer transporter ExbD [Marinobacter sp. AL4B]
MQLVDPRPSRPMPIRITPLIDVVFILLVFFMLTTRLMPLDHLELANSTKDRQNAAGEPLPELLISAGGSVKWQESQYSLSELLPALKAAGVNEANLAAAPDSALANFTSTLSALDHAGITAHWKRETP